VGRWQPRSGRGIDAKIDAPLVKRRDLISGDEPLTLVRAHHDAVEDVELWRRDNVIDGARLLATRRVDRDALVEHLVSNRKPLVHKPQTT
jgi:uncharacterized protein (UPF0297 family)